MQFIVHTTPPPDDQVLSPLLDPRVTAIELRDAKYDDLLARTRFDPPQAGMAATTHLDLGALMVSGKRDLRMLALGAAGQQVLGVALTRNAEWSFGDTKSIHLELRRPLFFFGGGGGGGKLTALVQPPNQVFAPIRQLFTPLLDETKLRVIDPNSVTPLLTGFDRQLDSNPANQVVTAATGTFDGQSLLVANVAGNLHVVDTLSLADQRSVALPNAGALLAQQIVVDSTDSSAVVLMAPSNPPLSGLAGRVVFLRNLAGLRSTTASTDGDPLAVDIESTLVSPIGSPLSAAFAPDGLVDVLFAKAPLQVGQPDCANLGGSAQAILRRYDPATAMPREQLALPYTSAVAYTRAGERVLVQPCLTPAGATRSGQVVIQSSGGDKILAAAGVADVAATRSALIAVGRDDLADSPTTTMHATVNILQTGADKWATSQFELSPWMVPYRITTDGSGNPYTSSLDISFAATDALVYSIAVTPDRGRAMALMRVQHKTRNVFLSTAGNGAGTVNCFIDWSGYTYHVLLINLQSGAREQDYLVGVQNQTCSSRSVDANNNVLGTCFTPCDASNIQPYLLGYAKGYIPSAASVLFGR